MRKVITCLVLLSALGSNALFAADTTPKFSCVLTDAMKDAKTPSAAKDSFASTTPEIFLVCSTSDVNKGDTVKAVWIAVDTQKVAPDNYQIAAKALPVEEQPGKGDVYTSNMSLTKPDKGWPAGTYKVDLYYNDKLADTFNYKVVN